MTDSQTKGITLGINGLGRIGKLFLWTQLARKDFSNIVINIGRKSGSSLQSVIDSILTDTSYRSLGSYLFGTASRVEVDRGIIDEEKGLIQINGMPITILTSHRNPKDVQWGDASIVVDATGQFNDPNSDAQYSQGSVRGHLLSPNVKKVIISSPFKLQPGEEMPADVVTIVLGVNGHEYNPSKHNIVSNASCTTTCLAHMLNPLVKTFGADCLISMNMRTIHAATGKQTVLDCLPKEGDTDPVKYRSVLNNIFLTTTGAAKTLQYVMPEVKDVPFSAIAIRVPTTTGSLVIMDAVWSTKGEKVSDSLAAKDINHIYMEESRQNKGYLRFSEKPLVSTDIIGRPHAAAIIHGDQTAVIHPNYPVVTTLVYGWYDNELGSYVNMLADQAISVANAM